MNQELSANTTLSHYRIVSKLGAGGMGEVYLAEDTRLGRQVALKILPTDFTKDADRLRRFKQEAKAASALNHPNIITVHDIGESEAGHFIVMELVAGHTLRAVIAEDNSIETLLSLGSQLAKALSAAHVAGITHRDIKPDNIMVRYDGYVKVLDFGLARLLPSTANDSQADTIARQTNPGSLLGTVAYMSPEQARGETVSHPSDIFSLGIVLYELATRQHPFKAETLVGYLHAITLQNPAPLTRLSAKVPDVLNGLILRMLEKEANKRPTASQVAQALQEIERVIDREKGRQGEGETLILSPMFFSSVSSATSAPIRHIVGREQERAELHAAFNGVKGGRGSLVCVAGEPGIGKTTLVEDFLVELAIENQCTIARGRCSERLAGTGAYLPLLEALESLLRHDTAGGSEPGSFAAKMRQIAPTWYTQVVPLSGDSEESARLLAEAKTASQDRLKRELGSLMQEIARQRPLVLFFDDLHWADVSTIDLLSFLAGKFDGLSVLIVVTYRPSDMLLSKHPFLQIKPDLQAHGVCRELLLEFLNEVEIAEYLALEFAGHRFTPEFPKLIHAKTEGSPLFMADLLRYLRDRGVIVQTSGDQSGIWTLAQALPDIERELPESVRGMIERKIAQLSEDDRKLLTCASVQGYMFDSAVLAQVLNLGADEVEERLEKLERIFAFVKLRSEAEFPNRTLTLKYRFVHVLYQNALYGSLRATRRTTLSAAVAQSLLGFYGEQSSAIASELAALLEAARDFAGAARYYLAAAQNTSRLSAFRESGALARRGLAMLQTLPSSPELINQELNLQLALGVAMAYIQGFAVPEVASAYGRARELCQQAEESPELFLAMTGVHTHQLIRGELDTCQELSENMLRIALKLEDTRLIAVACFARGSCMQHLGELQSAEEYYQRALELYNPQDAQQPYTYISDPGVGSCSLSAEAMWLLGYPDKALQRGQQAIVFASAGSRPTNLGFALTLNAIIHWYRREAALCLEQAEAVMTLAREKDLAENVAWSRIWRGWALAMQNSVADGITEIHQAIGFLRAIGAEISMPSLLGVLAESLLKAGQIEESLSAVEEGLAFARKNKNCLYEAELHRLKGELLLKLQTGENPEPDLSASELCFQQAIEVGRQQKAKSLELRAVTSLARLWQRQGKVAEAKEMLAEIYGWFTEGFDTADLKEARMLLDEFAELAVKQ